MRYSSMPCGRTWGVGDANRPNRRRFVAHRLDRAPGEEGAYTHAAYSRRVEDGREWTMPPPHATFAEAVALALLPPLSIRAIRLAHAGQR
jgi:hypothetical protein